MNVRVCDSVGICACVRERWYEDWHLVKLHNHVSLVSVALQVYLSGEPEKNNDLYAAYAQCRQVDQVGIDRVTLSPLSIAPT